MGPSQYIQIKGSTLTVDIANQEKHFTLAPLPGEFIDWQVNERLKIFDDLTKQKKPTFFSPHLPTLLTISDKTMEFPINAASKGVGLVPYDDQLHSLSQRLQESIKTLQGLDLHTSLLQRLEIAKLFYGSQNHINRFCLGGLEIFETTSFSNIIRDPRVSLFFVGNSPTYLSYQINCIAEIIPSDQWFYKFISSMRSLFEMESFHFQQPKYPFAVKYHTIQVLDKSLKIRGK